MTTTQHHELVEIQETLYNSKVPTRRWLHCMRRDWVVSHINQYAKNHSLEVGPGSGVYLPYLSETSVDVIAADIEPIHLEHLKPLEEKYKNLKLMKDDITNTALQNTFFDFILCSEVIEHIENSQAVLNNFAKILKPDGTLVLTTPQKFSTLEVLCKIAFLPGIIQIVRLIYGEAILETGHINCMTEKTLSNQIQQSGFTVVKKEKFGVYLPVIAEFMGNFGLKIQQALQRWILKTGIFEGTLWTQCYVLKKTEQI